MATVRVRSSGVSPAFFITMSMTMRALRVALAPVGMIWVATTVPSPSTMTASVEVEPESTPIT